MKFRKVGDTGLRTSEVVFGGGAVGGLLIDDDRDFRVQGVKRALDLGISWFDTAPSYGNGNSEINLGEILEKFGSDPNISTKVSIPEGCSEDLIGQIKRSVESSLLRLGRDKVDIVFLHNPTTKERGDQPVSLAIDDVLGKNGIVAGFEQLRKDGLADFFGFTASGDSDCLRLLVKSREFHATQVFHNLVNPSAGSVLHKGYSGENYENIIRFAAYSGIGVFNVRTLAAGAVVRSITGSSQTSVEQSLGRVPYEAGAGSEEPTPGIDVRESLKRMEPIWELLSSVDGTDAQKAIRFALTNPGVSGVILGFSNIDQIQESVKSVDMGGLPEDVLQKLNQLYRCNSKFRTN